MPAGPDAEHQIGALQRAHVGALHRRAGGDDAAARADLRHAVLRAARPSAHGGSARRHRRGRSARPSRRARRAPAARRAPSRRPLPRPGQRDDVAVRVRLDAETLLDQGQMGVVLAQHLGQQAIVFERNNQASARFARVRRLGRLRRGRPASTCQIADLPAIRTLGNGSRIANLARPWHAAKRRNAGQAALMPPL